MSKKFDFPILYSVDKSGRERMWKTWTVDNVMHFEYGLVKKSDGKSGKKTQSERAVKNDKTLGVEQAKFVAETEWIKQLQKGYTPKETDKKGMEMYNKIKAAKKKQGGHNINVKTVVNKKVTLSKTNPLFVDMEKDEFPMKAKEWEHEKRCYNYFDFKGGVYIQPKLDGIRCLALPHNKLSSEVDSISLSTNTSKQFPWFKSLKQELREALSRYPEIKGLDGELYATSIERDGKVVPSNNKFSVIQGICALRLKEPHELEEQLKLHVFDVYDLEKTQKERFELLDIFFETEYTHIKRVKTNVIKSIHDISVFHSKCETEGYEGIILRANDMMYEPKVRSNKMRKYKHFDDSEFLVTGVNLKHGVGIENFTWECKDNDIVVYAKPQGSIEQRKEWYTNKEKYIGKHLTVKYQGVSGTGVPRFPVAKEFRDISEM